MPRDPDHVLHERFRLFEDVVVDPLMQIVKRRAALKVSGAVGVVDVPASVGLRSLKLSEDIELARHRADVVFAV